MFGGTTTRGFEDLRREMVQEQIRDRGIRCPRVLDAMLRVPRHEFVPEDLIDGAYADQPLPIGEGQTISQPFMVGAMTEALELEGEERVLEVGTGSGYQAALLALLAREVHSVESIAGLATAAQERLARLGCSNVHVHTGDGTLGWAEAAPYDAIVVTAAAPRIPPPLVEQLAEGGRLVIPVGPATEQELLLVRKNCGQTTSEALHYCRFVPLLGRHGWQSPHS
ncbi:MAG: protein-L-isoaspartate(D-aspartate) O-methyltransferase [Acidobacteria bacterium]|nr:protein-L-isoaspartate(D-aspartate) O-methyltransferase [Acidobacteriota bacterium]MBI3662644.1 protein-L-isoaspartate(D-aspartate) O-methyltransferase [Acidobacteriota bacterium]